MSYGLGQMDRILANLIKIGRIQSVDLGAGTATVDFDGEVVADLEWSKSRAGNDRTWNGGYSKDEQVLVLSPSGDLSQGVIAFSISQNTFPNAGTTENPTKIYEDGTVIEYDKSSHTLVVDASASSGHVLIKCDTATIKADSSITLDAPKTICSGNLTVAKSLSMGAGGGSVTLKGNVELSGGTLTHNGKNIGDNHKHSGVQTGGGNTGGVV
ncbi:phage baseplate assembly protein V [Acinetobacter sp. WCHAc060033]|uniref:phage baseplate assembly protein V n=1 Tax=Acinetobacter sp. WCHAc060033 TaxID=2518624 RepID=UPI0010236664|nr:phage baseplate assembly protein V [Acinetobacter sp. WCHAc060033]RZG78351.1 phage baseplate assembly protein V [Acinetobacter sp. WCHAc060033]